MTLPSWWYGVCFRIFFAVELLLLLSGCQFQKLREKKRLFLGRSDVKHSKFMSSFRKLKIRVNRTLNAHLHWHCMNCRWRFDRNVFLLYNTHGQTINDSRTTYNNNNISKSKIVASKQATTNENNNNITTTHAKQHTYITHTHTHAIQATERYFYTYPNQLGCVW